MHVVLLCTDPEVTYSGSRGSSVRLRAMAAAFARLGRRVTVFAERGGDPVTARESRGVALDSTARDRDTAKIAARLATLEPDLVVERFTAGAPEGAIAARTVGVRHFYEAIAPHAGAADTLARHPERRAISEGLASSLGAAASTPEVAAEIAAIAPRDFPVTVAPHGAGPEFFEPPMRTPYELARRLSGAEQSPVIGFAGAFDPSHDLVGLTRALGLLRPAGAARLLLLGDGPSRQEVIAASATEGVGVTLAGRVAHDAMPAWLSVCDVVVIPFATDDGGDGSLIAAEAMAAGRPIVASATAPMRRMLGGGQRGLLVAPGDSRALAEAIMRMCIDRTLRRRLTENARSAASRHHHWDVVAEHLLDFVEGLGASSPQEPGSATNGRSLNGHAVTRDRMGSSAAS